MQHRHDVTRNVIFAENSSTGLVELRYLAQTDVVYVRNIILDPTRFRLREEYGKIFEKACFVRSVRIQQDLLVPDAALPRPVITKEQIQSPFDYFKNDIIVEKRQTWTDLHQVSDILIDLDAEPLQQAGQQTSPQSQKWAELVSQFGLMALDSVSEPSVTTPAKPPPPESTTDSSLHVCSATTDFLDLGTSNQTADGFNEASTQVDLLTSSPVKSTLKSEGVLVPTKVDSHLSFSPQQPFVPGMASSAQDMQTKGLETNTNVDITVAARQKIIAGISQMLDPLRLYQGSIVLKAEIGRIWFTNVNWQHIGIPGLKQHSRAKDVESMEVALQSHCATRDLHFNNILTLEGGDINHITNLKEPGGKQRMWVPDSRRSFYEFWCQTKSHSGKKTYFILEIDAASFTYEIRKADAGESNIFVHCAKHDFDFRFVVEVAPDIKKSCEAFAREVVASLQVG